MSPVRENQFRSNTFRGEEKSKSSNRERQVKEKADMFPKLRINNGKLVKITGLLFLLFAIFMMVAFTSFLFTWESDQSYVSPANGGWDNLFKSSEELVKSGIQNPIVENWLGKLGALLSNQFIYEWFGLSSFIFIAILFITGYRLLFKVTVVSIGKMLSYSFFLIIYLSVAFGFFHSFSSDFPHYVEGQFGFWTNRLLQIQIGNAGIGALLIFTGLAALVIAYNIDFKLPERKRRQRPLKTFEDPDAGHPDGKIDFPTHRQHINAEPPAPIETQKPVVKHNLYEPEPEPETETGTTDHGHSVHGVNTLLAGGASAAVAATAAAPIATALVPPVSGPSFTVEDTRDVHDFDNTEEDEVGEEPFLEEEASVTTPLELSTAPKQELDTATIKPEDHELIIEKPVEEKSADELVQQFGKYDPTLDLSSYQHPTLDLLENHKSNKIPVSAEELEANKNRIVATLNNYNIEIEKIMATIGPTVTLYEIIPAPGVRISKIKNLEDDIALSLAALGIRIIAPMPGKGTIGIEVPNQQPEMVAMRSIMATEKFKNTHMDLPIALGKTISNEVYIADLAKMPHLLVAGATGQGKSVGINAILVSLLYKMHPSQLKFVLVDPKKVELTLFRKIERHFLAKLPGEEDAIITDTKKVINTLNSLCIEMDQRYDLLKDAQVRNLKEYNQKFVNRRLNPENGHRFLPFIVLIVDEFADLMMTAGKEVETPIARLAQLARAVGIHLVIATQRPSVNIITGTIKANFPARIAFRVLSKIDSRTILDSGGADQLIGRGDMLLASGSDLIRLQCAFVDTPEVERISDFIGQQRGYSSAWMLPEYVDENGEGSSVKDFDPSDRDPLFEDAAKLIVLHQQGSTSLIQRKLKLGYNRAGRIIDQLEAAGVVGPFEGSKAREVLIPDEYALMEFLDNLG